jgi:deoxyadenosine/deoxycytidine kinase
MSVTGAKAASSFEAVSSFEAASSTNSASSFEAGSSATEQPRVIIIEGEIAVGKTVLVSLLAAALDATPVYEPVDTWMSSGILEKFYADPARYGYAFQTFVYVTRIQEIQRAVADAARRGARPFFILERSPVTDEIFMELQRGAVSDVEIDVMYEAWRRTFTPLLPIDLATATVLYLKPSLETSMRRLASRARPGETESGVPLEYQRRLRRAHEALLEGAHAEEFPLLAGRPPPYSRSAVKIVPPSIAELNFRDAGTEQQIALSAILGLLADE